MAKLATSQISIFSLVSVAEQAGLILTRVQTLKTGLLIIGLIMDLEMTRLTEKIFFKKKKDKRFNVRGKMVKF